MVKNLKKVFSIISISACIACCCLFVGCASSTDNVPGAYSVSASNVSTAGIDPTNACLVVVPAQNQAFQVPEGALAYAASAIENNMYSAYVIADGKTPLRGKLYDLNSTSTEELKQKIASAKTDFFNAVCSKRDQTGKIDLLKAINDAANDLNAKAPSGNKTICVVSSGLGNDGLLAMSKELLDSNAADIAEQLANKGAIANLEGITVVFFGLGQSTSSQTIPATAKMQLETLYQTVVERAGGTCVIATDVLTPLDCDDELMDITPIDLGEDTLTLTKGQSTQVTFDQTELQFKADSAEFVDNAAARNTLTAVANAVIQKGYTVSSIDGYVADTGGSEEGAATLSLSRAQAVADELVSMGVSESKIVSVEGHGAEDSTAMASGSFSEEQAAKDRRVTITLSNNAA